MSVLLGEYCATSHVELTHLNSLPGQKRQIHIQQIHMHKLHTCMELCMRTHSTELHFNFYHYYSLTLLSVHNTQQVIMTQRRGGKRHYQCLYVCVLEISPVIN